MASNKESYYGIALITYSYSRKEKEHGKTHMNLMGTIRGEDISGWRVWGMDPETRGLSGQQGSLNDYGLERTEEQLLGCRLLRTWPHFLSHCFSPIVSIQLIHFSNIPSAHGVLSPNLTSLLHNPCLSHFLFSIATFCAHSLSSLLECKWGVCTYVDTYTHTHGLRRLKKSRFIFTWKKMRVSFIVSFGCC